MRRPLPEILREIEPDSARVVLSRQFVQYGIYLSQQQRNYHQALNNFNLAVDFYSDDFALAQRGAFFLGRKRLAEAESDLRKATHLNPNNAFAWSSLGSVYHQRYALEQRNELLGESITCFSNAIERNQRDEFARVSRGEMYRMQGNFDLALQDLEQALTHPSNDYIHSFALASKAEILRCQGKTDEAKAAFKKAVRLNTQNSFAWEKLGEIDQTRGIECLQSDHLHQEAQQHFSTAFLSFFWALHHDPFNEFALILRGETYYYLAEIHWMEETFTDYRGRVEASCLRALADFAQVKASPSNQFLVFSFSGKIHRLLGEIKQSKHNEREAKLNFDLAADLLIKALNCANPDDVPDLVNNLVCIGKAYRLHHYDDDARDVFNKVLGFDPINQVALSELGQINQRRQAEEEARRGLFEFGICKSPKSPQIGDLPNDDRDDRFSLLEDSPNP